jgi:hypothetical protein
VNISSEDLKAKIEAGGYFPTLMWGVIEDALAGEEIKAFLIHQEPTLTAGEVGSHVSAMVLTPTRLVTLHIDDAVEGPDDEVTAAVTTDAVALRAIHSVAATHVVRGAGMGPRAVTLAVQWGGASHFELEPAQCGDPACPADHGYTGSMTTADMLLRVSEEGDGHAHVAEALEFMRHLSKATSLA